METGNPSILALNNVSENSSILAQWPVSVNAVYWTTLLLLVISFLLFMYIIIMRIRFEHEKYYKEKFRTKWRPIIFKWMNNESVDIPKLSYKNRILMMQLWYSIRAHIHDESAGLLNEFAILAGLENTISSILTYRNLNDENKKIGLQLLAVHVATAINTEPVIIALTRAAASSNFRVSVAATCGLVYLNYEHAELAVISTLIRYKHWARYVAFQISKAGGAKILHLIGDQLDNLPGEQARNLIALVELSDDKSLLPFLVKRLHRTGDSEEQAIIIRALARIGEPLYKREIVPFLKSKVSFLRTQAAAAMGSLGSKDDLHRLYPLLSDPEWWVRYRVTQSILKIQPLTEDSLNELRSNITDQFGRDMLNHVYMEKSL